MSYRKEFLWLYKSEYIIFFLFFFLFFFISLMTSTLQAISPWNYHAFSCFNNFNKQSSQATSIIVIYYSKSCFCIIIFWKVNLPLGFIGSIDFITRNALTLRTWILYDSYCLQDSCSIFRTHYLAKVLD